MALSEILTDWTTAIIQSLCHLARWAQHTDSTRVRGQRFQRGTAEVFGRGTPGPSMGLAFAKASASRYRRQPKHDVRSPSALQTGPWPRYRARQQGCGHLPKLAPAPSSCRESTSRSTPRFFRYAIDASSGKDVGVLGQLDERLGKEAAVAVDDRLPVPRAVEHVEAVGRCCGARRRGERHFGDDRSRLGRQPSIHLGRSCRECQPRIEARAIFERAAATPSRSSRSP